MRVLKHQLGLIPTLVETGWDAKVVLAGEQNGKYYIWVEELPRYKGARAFQVFGTGHDIPENARHHYSFQDKESVWHVYELTE